jgi:carbon-monoxide dehydrogenase small subunit
MKPVHTVNLRVNGVAVQAQAEPRQHLADFLREQVGLTGTHVGCEYGVCGACTVRVDGAIVRACLMLAVQAQGCDVQTIEGLDAQGQYQDLQQAFVDRNALQCGFCTPGMLMCASALLEQGGCPNREEIRAHIGGNYCRCTGYEAIVDAIETTAQARSGEKKAPRP